MMTYETRMVAIMKKEMMAKAVEWSWRKGVVNTIDILSHNAMNSNRFWSLPLLCKDQVIIERERVRKEKECGKRKSVKRESGKRMSVERERALKERKVVVSCVVCVVWRKKQIVI
jgi:hypothetical protein